MRSSVITSSPVAEPWWPGPITWTRYSALVDGQKAGYMVVATLEPGLGFIAYVGVAPDYRRRGIAVALHEAAARDHGTLAIEDFATDGELAVWSSLAGRGWELGERPAAGWRIYRHRRLVERMLTAHRVED